MTWVKYEIEIFRKWIKQMRCTGIANGWVLGKKKKTSFLSLSSKQKCMIFFIKKMILKEIAQSIIN